MGELGMVFVGACVGLAARALHPRGAALSRLGMALSGALGALAAGVAGQATLFAKDGSIASITGVIGAALVVATGYALVRR